MDDEIPIVFDGSEIADYWSYLKSVCVFFLFQMIIVSMQLSICAFY